MDLGKNLKNHMIKHTIFYITLDPERALGLEDALLNYTIICPYKSQLTEKLKKVGIEILVLEDKLPAREVEKIVERGTYGMMQSDFVRKYINTNVQNGKPRILLLKTSQLIEDFCKKQEWKLLAPKAKIAEQFENKISQYILLRDAVPYPKTFIKILGDLSGSDPDKFIGVRSRGLVLQFNRGHSGNTTFFIKSKKEFEKLAKKFPKREAKISEYIKGKTYTLNCLVVKSGEVITGSLSEQITGLKSATSNPNTTCGNDFTSPRKLAGKQIKEIQGIAQSTGTTLCRKGYRGLFGIDVIIQNKTGKVYFIEVNTHQPASVSFEAKLHRKIGKMPPLAFLILDSFGCLSKLSKKDLPPIILPFSAKQIIYRNKTAKTLQQRDVAAKCKNKGFISRTRLIRPNEEIYRMQYGA